MNETTPSHPGDAAHAASPDGGGRGSLIGGVDIGGTKLAVGVSDAAGNLLAERRQPTHVERGPEAITADVISMLQDAAAEAARKAEAPSDRLAFLGVAAPGPLSQKQGVILNTPNMPGWDGFPLLNRLQTALDCPAALENDANAACLGEALFGAGRGKRFVAYFTVSTGVGGGFVENGRVFHGADGNAAEFGHHIIMPFNGALCGCGGYGHVESYCNGASIVRRAREAIAQGRATSLLDIAGSLDAITPKHLAEAAEGGDRMSLDIWEETGALLGVAVVNVIHMFNPDVVVLGGGITNVGDLLFAPLRRSVAARVMPDYRGSFTIEHATLGGQVGIRGAIGLALERGILKPEN